MEHERMVKEDARAGFEPAKPRETVTQERREPGGSAVLITI
jgi:hypothetical protein